VAFEKQDAEKSDTSGEIKVARRTCQELQLPRDAG